MENENNAYEDAQRLFHDWSSQWIDTGYKEINITPDVMELVSLFQIIGFNILYLDVEKPQDITPLTDGSKGTRITVTCGNSGLRATLESAAACRCPKNISDIKKWEVSGTEPNKEKEEIKETGDNILSRVANSTEKLVNNMLSRRITFTIPSESDDNQNIIETPIISTPIIKLHSPEVPMSPARYRSLDTLTKAGNISEIPEPGVLKKLLPSLDDTAQLGSSPEEIKETGDNILSRVANSTEKLVNNMLSRRITFTIPSESDDNQNIIETPIISTPIIKLHSPEVPMSPARYRSLDTLTKAGNISEIPEPGVLKKLLPSLDDTAQLGSSPEEIKETGDNILSRVANSTEKLVNNMLSRRITFTIPSESDDNQNIIETPITSTLINKLHSPEVPMSPARYRSLDTLTKAGNISEIPEPGVLKKLLPSLDDTAQLGSSPEEIKETGDNILSRVANSTEKLVNNMLSRRITFTIPSESDDNQNIIETPIISTPIIKLHSPEVPMSPARYRSLDTLTKAGNISEIPEPGVLKKLLPSLDDTAQLGSSPNLSTNGKASHTSSPIKITEVVYNKLKCIQTLANDAMTLLLANDNKRANTNIKGKHVNPLCRHPIRSESDNKILGAEVNDSKVQKKLSENSSGIPKSGNVKPPAKRIGKKADYSHVKSTIPKWNVRK